jgi:hypothetical protein
VSCATDPARPRRELDQAVAGLHHAAANLASIARQYREGRQAAQGPALHLYALGAAVVFLPFALVATVIEVAARNGGTIYVEARRDAKTPAR